MVRIDAWDEFSTAATEMLHTSPNTTRFSIKYKAGDTSAIIVKVTDDRTCLKFHTDQASDLKRVDKLGALFIHVQSTGPQ